MNIFTITILASIVCGIYAVNRGDRNSNLGFPDPVHSLPVSPSRPREKVLGVKSRYPHCYDDQVRQDQFFDNSFICYDTLNYPSHEIDYALKLTENRQFRNFLQLVGKCFDETNFMMDTHSVPNYYNFKCVCESNRRIITSVFYQGQRCHVVEPHRQKIYHADCRNACSLSYGYIEGYFCVNRGWVDRRFLVYCEDNKEAFMKYNHGITYENRGIGGFYYMNHVLPSYCGCRKYSC